MNSQTTESRVIMDTPVTNHEHTNHELTHSNTRTPSLTNSHTPETRVYGHTSHEPRAYQSLTHTFQHTHTFSRELPHTRDSSHYRHQSRTASTPSMNSQISQYNFSHELTYTRNSSRYGHTSHEPRPATRPLPPGATTTNTHEKPAKHCTALGTHAARVSAKC